MDTAASTERAKDMAMTSTTMAAAAVLVAFGAISTASTAAPVRTFLTVEISKCSEGYVWREANASDRVCVRPQRRALAASENATAADRVDPSGAHGPNSCRNGFVWRAAFPGDVVCVTPARRSQVAQENADGPSHRQSH
jgi:hypothetical protein